MIRRFDAEALVEVSAARSVGRSSEVASSGIARDTPDQIAYREGYADGFAAGQSDGLLDAEQRMETIEAEVKMRADDELVALTAEREHLASIAEGIGNTLTRHAETVETLSIEIAFGALTRMLSAIDGDRALIGRLCTVLIEEYQGSAREIVVSAHDISDMPAEIPGVLITADAGLASGECRLRTTRGEAETSIAQRLDAMRLAFLQGLEARRT